MSIYQSSYNTTIGVGMVTKQIEHALKESFIKDVLYNRHLDLITSKNYKPVFVTGEMSSESNIPFFIHPLIVENVKGMNFLCCDIRPFVRSNGNASWNEVDVRNATEFQFAKNRMIMNLAWLSGEINQMRLNLSFAGTIFASWLSETISKRFALDPKDQMILSIISHFYYQSLFYAEDQFEEEMLQKFAVHTIKATRAPSSLVFEVFDKILRMRNLSDYCENVKQILENIRLTDLNEGLIITMVGNTWFGLNFKEILAVALEHPPTWIAIVRSALFERTYKNSQIARIAERFAKNGAGTEFMSGFDNLVRSMTEVPEPKIGFKSFE